VLSYDHRHPNWRESRRKLEESFEQEMLTDREVGRLPSSLTVWDIREKAREKAIAVVAETANQFEQGSAAQKRKTGEAL
jgi:hypothetical protein